MYVYADTLHSLVAWATAKCVHVYVCMYECMYVCICRHIAQFGSLSNSKVCLCIWMYVCMYVYTCSYICKCKTLLCVCMYVRIAHAGASQTSGAFARMGVYMSVESIVKARVCMYCIFLPRNYHINEFRANKCHYCAHHLIDELLLSILVLTTYMSSGLISVTTVRIIWLMNCCYQF